MFTVYIRQQALWTPLENKERALEEYLNQPFDFDEYGLPELPSVPKRKQRRFNLLTKIVLATSLSLEVPEETDILSVFASQHGDLSNSVAILSDIANCELVRPQQFSNSVLNVPTGYYTIEKKSTGAATAVSDRENSFSAGFLESILQLQKNPGVDLIYTCADLPLPEVLEKFECSYKIPYSLSLHLSLTEREGAIPIQFSVEEQDSSGIQGKYIPQSILFYTWLKSDQAKAFTTGKGACGYRWSKQ